MARRTRLHLLGFAAFAAISLSACGVPEEEIPGSLTPEQADGLTASLDAVEADFEDRNCDEAEAGAADFLSQVNGLPAEVGPETKTRLRGGADQLIELVSDCTEPETGNTQPPEPSTTSTEEEVAPPPVESSTTETMPPETEPPPEEEPVEPPDPPEDPGGTPPGDSSGPGSGGTGSGGTGSSGSGSVGGSSSGGIGP